MAMYKARDSIMMESDDDLKYDGTGLEGPCYKLEDWFSFRS